MSRVWSSAVVAGLVSGMLGACGGSGPTSPPPPPPPPPVDTARNVAVHAGAGQSAPAGQPVPIPPAIRVTNGAGAPVSGMTVTFAVTAGGGSVTGGTATTGSDGVAAVGSWVLGAVGANALAATVTGATTGSPVSFTATGQPVIVQPGADTTLSGVVSVTRFTVPVGVTVTVRDSLVLRADSAVEIRGRIEGNCVPVTIEAGQALTLKGTVRNACAQAGPRPRLTLVGRGGYRVDSAAVETSGDLLLTNDPTLTEAEVEPGASAAPGRVSTAAVAATDCIVANSRFDAKPTKAANGVAGQTGTAGADGTLMRGMCRGTLRLEGGVVIVAQEGGDGGMGQHQPGSGPASAEGGPGGAGGRLELLASGEVISSGPLNLFASGVGGRGGDARAIAGPDPAGPVAPQAVAGGGTGGAPGLAAIRAASRIEFAAITRLSIGRGGIGGNATAVGARGADAAGPTTPAQAGGDAFAFAGLGGHSPSRQLTPQNLTVVGPENLLVIDGDGGRGGDAEATGGEGGTGTAGRADGGRGGISEGAGGLGGDALLVDHLGKRFGAGGAGGAVRLAGGRGGRGAAQCSLPLGLLPGGKGGDGGAVRAFLGIGGIGRVGGPDGAITLNGVGNGGNGGHGEPAGQGGAGGAATVPAGANRVGLNHAVGQRGFDCIGGFGDVSAIITGTLDPNPCPSLDFTQTISSFSADPVAYQISESIPHWGPGQTTGQLSPAPGPTTEWSQTPVVYSRDLCSMQSSGPVVAGPVSFLFTLGPTSVTKTFNVRFEFRP